MHASLNVGYQAKSGPGKIHEMILVIHNLPRELTVSGFLEVFTAQRRIRVELQLVLVDENSL